MEIVFSEKNVDELVRVLWQKIWNSECQAGFKVLSRHLVGGILEDIVVGCSDYRLGDFQNKGWAGGNLPTI